MLVHLYCILFAKCQCMSMPMSVKLYGFPVLYTIFHRCVCIHFSKKFYIPDFLTTYLIKYILLNNSRYAYKLSVVITLKKEHVQNTNFYLLCIYYVVWCIFKQSHFKDKIGIWFFLLKTKPKSDVES